MSGVIGSDVVGLNSSSVSAAFADKNVATGKAVNISGLALSGGDAANYTLASTSSATSDITALALTLSGTTANNKVYDGNVAASLSNAGVLSGVIGGDAVAVNSGSSTASFVNTAAGVARTINVSGLTLSGGDAGNYSITGLANSTADITPKAMSISGLTANNKVYDGNTSASLGGTASLSGVIGADAVSIGGAATAAFADKNVGTGKTVVVTGLSLSGAAAVNDTVAASFNTTAAIAAKALTVSGITASNKTYDGTLSATLSGSAGLTGVIGNEAVAVSGATASFADKNVGNAKTVNVSGITLAGTDAGNYTLASTTATATATITPKALTVTGTTAANKVEDGTNVATLAATGTLVGVHLGDAVCIGTSVSSAAFASATAGTGITVNVFGMTLAVSDAGNYSFTGNATTTANITAAPAPAPAPAPSPLPLPVPQFSASALNGLLSQIGGSATAGGANSGNAGLAGASGLAASSAVPMGMPIEPAPTIASMSLSAAAAGGVPIYNLQTGAAVLLASTASGGVASPGNPSAPASAAGNIVDSSNSNSDVNSSGNEVGPGIVRIHRCAGCRGHGIQDS